MKLRSDTIKRSNEITTQERLANAAVKVVRIKDLSELNVPFADYLGASSKDNSPSK